MGSRHGHLLNLPHVPLHFLALSSLRLFSPFYLLSAPALTSANQSKPHTNRPLDLCTCRDICLESPSPLPSSRHLLDKTSRSAWELPFNTCLSHTLLGWVLLLRGPMPTMFTSILAPVTLCTITFFLTLPCRPFPSGRILLSFGPRAWTWPHTH